MRGGTSARSNGDGPVRVLHVVTTGERRGAELSAFDLIRALNESGVTQRVAVLKGSPPLQVAYEAPTTVLPSNDHVLPGLRMDRRTLAALRRLMSAEPPGLVHAHGGEALKYAVFAGRRRVPVLYRRIGLAHPAITRGPRRAVHARLMRRSRRVVAAADAVRRETVQVFGVPADRVVTIPRGIDVRRLTPTRGRDDTRTLLEIAPGQRVVLSLGAFHWEKDPVAAVEVAARVMRAEPETVLLMAGDGALRGDVERAVGRLGLGGRVRLLGNRADVGDLLAASDLLVLSSRSEGMPGCLIEAGLSGLPVATFDVGGAREVVVDSRTGFVVPRGDVDALAARAIRLLSDEGLRREMGAAARGHCESAFDIRSIAPRYLAVYREVLS